MISCVAGMDKVIWATVRAELSGILTRLIGEEVYLSEEEARRVVERLSLRCMSPDRTGNSSSDLLSVG